MNLSKKVKVLKWEKGIAQRICLAIKNLFQGLAHSSFRINFSNTSDAEMKKMPSFSIGRDSKLKMDNMREFMSKPGPLAY